MVESELQLSCDSLRLYDPSLLSVTLGKKTVAQRQLSSQGFAVEVCSEVTFEVASAPMALPSTASAVGTVATRRHAKSHAAPAEARDISTISALTSLRSSAGRGKGRRSLKVWPRRVMATLKPRRSSATRSAFSTWSRPM